MPRNAYNGRMQPAPDITHLLDRAGSGDRDAWDRLVQLVYPDAADLEWIAHYPESWAREQFGAAHAREIGDILTRYTQYNARRKPELLDAATWSLLHDDLTTARRPTATPAARQRLAA